MVGGGRRWGLGVYPVHCRMALEPHPWVSLPQHPHPTRRQEDLSARPWQQQCLQEAQPLSNVEQIANGNLLYDSGKPNRGSVIKRGGRGWGKGWEMGGRFRRRGTYVNLWLTHLDVWQRPTQYCEAVILQWNQFVLKNDKKKYCEAVILQWKKFIFLMILKSEAIILQWNKFAIVCKKKFEIKKWFKKTLWSNYPPMK